VKGPAFIPVTVGTISDFYDKFGRTDGKKFGPLAVANWLGEGAGSATYIRVLGAGDGKQRNVDGSVTNAGFVVGEQLPDETGTYVNNPYANVGGSKGRTYFLGAFMSESAGSTVFSDAGLQASSDAIPVVRGVLMAASGVVLQLSSTFDTSTGWEAPASNLIAIEGGAGIRGRLVGSVDVTSGKQEFVMFLNGHKGTDSRYPNKIVASFDVTSPAYFANKLNTDPYKLQEAGHCLYANWDIHPVLAEVTAEGVSSESPINGHVPASFLTTGSMNRNTGDSDVPNYEAFQDRFSNAKSPWVISQRFGGKPVDLFRFHSIDSGEGASTNYKISIENVVPSVDPANRYGTFDVVVRDFADRDGEVRAINQFRGLTLDPRSDKYISKVIGDVNAFFDFDREERAQKIVIEGNYPAQSNYIRVEVNPDIELGMVEPTALPIGFRGIDHLVTSGGSPLASSAAGVSGLSANFLKDAVTPPLPLRKKISLGSGDRLEASSRLYWGVQFEHVTNLADPNSSKKRDKSILSFAKFFPGYLDGVAHFITGSNSGQEDTAALGILDADRFCNNLFTLENVQVVTSSAGLADDLQWKNAVYVRDGNISADNVAKTRAFMVEDLSVSSNRKFAKFTMIMQGGFNGVNIFDRDSVELNNAAVTADMEFNARGRENGNCVKAYTKALEIMQNVVNVDIQLLAIPGIREEYVTTLASDAVRDRFDALYLMDVVEKNNLDEVIKYKSGSETPDRPHVSYTVTNFKNRAMDNSFAAAYFPNVTMQDPTTRTNLVVPPSVVVLGAMALNDRLGHPWFAPAGFTRGAIGNRAIEAQVALRQADMDILYDANINPIAAFDGSNGPVVWGQKTLQAAASALDRVNVRRLLIEIRRQVRDIAQTILFEPNRATTLARFTAAVTPRLQRIQAQAGLERFSVVIDSSTTTQQDIENNTIRGKIFVQPTKTIEFVSLDFVVANGLQAE
jgi:phage tail sheath protein FI